MLKELPLLFIETALWNMSKRLIQVILVNHTLGQYHKYNTSDMLICLFLVYFAKSFYEFVLPHDSPPVCGSFIFCTGCVIFAQLDEIFDTLFKFIDQLFGGSCPCKRKIISCGNLGR